MAEIGKPIREIQVEPIVSPIPQRETEPEPESKMTQARLYAEWGDAVAAVLAGSRDDIDRLVAAGDAILDEVRRLQADAALLKRIQDALVEACYDPDPTDPTPELIHSRVDWIGDHALNMRHQLDKFKALSAPPTEGGSRG